MKPTSDVPTSDASRSHEPVPPVPTGDALIDEIRTIKYELSARFGHDIEKLGDHLKTVQEEIARREPQRVIRRSKGK